MVKNKKGIYGKKSLLVGAALFGAGYLLYNQSQQAKDAGEGSLGGTDDLMGYQGFDIDPNSIPDQPDQVQQDPVFVFIEYDGSVIPDNPTDIPSNVPIASTGTGTLFQDAAVTGGAIGGNLMLPAIAKRINKLVDTKYLTSSVDDGVKQTPWQKFISDPYGLKTFDNLAVDKATKTGTREVAELAIDGSGKTIFKTIPKWAKTTKTVANFIPLLDIPIGAGLDLYFNKYVEDPSQKINWYDAIAANTAGELAQLGITGGAAAASSVVPVAGTIAGGVGGFVVGTGADIIATEGYYAARGKSSLFTGSGSKTTPNTSTGSSSSSQSSSQSKANQSTNAFVQMITAPAVNPFKSSGGSSSNRSSSSSSRNTSSNVSSSSSARTSSTAKSSAPRTAPKTSVSSRVASAVRSAPRRTVSRVKSVASRVSSWFRRR